MPKITPEMIEWWFWWQPQSDERYQVWFPESHFSIEFSKIQEDYFKCENLPTYQNNTQHPVEKIGGAKIPLRIDFVSPKEFGFLESVMQENNIPLNVCGHVGAFNGLIWQHT